MCTLSSEYFRESIRHEIRKARERFSGQELSDELSHIQKRLDSVELLTPDIVINLLLSYRDIQVRARVRLQTCGVRKQSSSVLNSSSCVLFSQDFDSMIKLVENLNNLPMCLVAKHQNIKFHYIFALNRYRVCSSCVNIDC